MKLHIFPTADVLLQNIAGYFIRLANESIAATNRFNVALSGGSSPEKLYALLASPAFKNLTDWTKIYFFLGDERYVPVTDDASNYRMANRVLFQPLEIEQSQIFAVDTSLVPEAAAADYAQKITMHFADANHYFDLILLGLGDNAHTASLFPHTDILKEQTPTVKSVYLPVEKIYRISFTAPLINNAANIAFLVYGDAKANAVFNVLKGEKDINQYPAQMIVPLRGNLDWFLDKAAAAKITDV